LKSILHDELGLERDRLEAGIELSVDFEVLVHIIVLMHAVLKDPSQEECGLISVLLRETGLWRCQAFVCHESRV